MSRPISTRCADRGRALAALGAVALAGCDQGSQSAFDVAGREAASIAELTWVLFVGGAVIFLMTLVLLAIALFSSSCRRERMATTGFVVWLGIGFPVAALTLLLVYGLTTTRTFVAAEAARPDIRVTGEMWWWRVEYLDDDGEVAFETANEIHLPLAESSDIAIESRDVIHSFWVPALGGKIDAIPGATNMIALSPDRAGVYRGQCAEYCGRQHALMAFEVVALAPDDYADWFAAQARPAESPRLSSLRAGEELFHDSGCGACHTVRGTDAEGTLGPDLTHVGSRRTIAAGTLPNNAGTLAAWISDSQHLKPGNAMPSFDTLDGPELRSIATYLENLE